MKGVALLGATGSIGSSTLDVLERHPDRYRVEALTANRDVAGMAALCTRLRPRVAAMGDADAALALERELTAANCPTEVLAGVDGLVAAATLDGPEVVVAAIVGPVDSEHNAIFQCLPAGFDRGLDGSGVRQLLLTASGGPFRETPLEALAGVTPDQACAHPNWVMGRKISVDSATMMNKGLEVIEACWLFGLPAERIEVVIHPQSTIHSMVQYADGSVLAELGRPDMRTAIAHALAWPERIDAGVAPLDARTLGTLGFAEPSFDRFPCLDLAYRAARAGGGVPTVLNAANEVAVAAFLAGRLPFPAIATAIDATLARCTAGDPADVDAILALDAEARVHAGAACAKLGGKAA